MVTPNTTSTPEQLQAELQAILNGPAGVPPVGVTPNFHDPQNLNRVFAMALTLCVTSTTLAVLTRMYTKKFLIQSWAHEDYALIMGWLGQIAQSIPSAMTTRHGGGVHMWNVQMKQFFALLYWVNLSSILYGPTIFFIKLSILLQYLRIFVPNRKGNMFMFVGVQACIWSLFLFYLVDTIFEIALCTPRKKIWNPLMTSGRCFNTDAAFQATGIFNVISDFVILGLPMPSLWKLQMPRRKKILMMAVFATGFLACVTSILRTYYTWKIVRSPDITYNMIIMGLWAYAEITIGIIVSCLPVFPKFFKHVGPKIYGTFSLGSLSGTLLRHKLRSTQNTDKTNTSSGIRQPFPRRGGENSIPKTWNDSYHSKAELKGEYITLDEYDIHQSTSAAMNGLTPTLADGPATKREDLEIGKVCV